MKLKEIAKQKPAGQPTRDQIEDLLSRWSAEAVRGTNFKINQDLSLDVEGNVDVDSKDIIRSVTGQKSLPVRFNFVNGEFAAVNCGLDSLDGLPRECRQGCHLYGNKFNTNELKHLPTRVGGVLTLYDNLNLKSLHNIHKTLKEMAGTLYIPKSLESNLLGVFMIKGLRSVQVSGNDQSRPSANLERAIVLINTYLAQTPKDVHKCQENLIDAGLSAFARI